MFLATKVLHPPSSSLPPVVVLTPGASHGTILQRIFHHNGHDGDSDDSDDGDDDDDDDDDDDGDGDGSGGGSARTCSKSCCRST